MLEKTLGCEIRNLDAVPADLKDLAVFHGHTCPGVVLMARLVQAAMKELGSKRHDHDMQAIVESGRCHIAPVEWFTGLMGLKKLIVKDWGRAAVTLYNRKTGRAVRAHLKPGFPPNDLLEGLDNEERFFKLIKIAPEEYVRVHEVRVTAHLPIPGPPKLVDFCDGCGERVLDGILKRTGGRQLCMACVQPYFEPASGAERKTTRRARTGTKRRVSTR